MVADTGRGVRDGGWEGDNLLAHPQMREIPSKCSSRTAHCFLVCQVFRVPRPSGGHAIVAREVVQPLSLDKAGDLMLFYCALCAAESRKVVARTHASRGMCRL